MVSPAKRHYMKMTAKQESTAAADSDIRPDANQYELMMAQLHTHTQQLKKIQSIKAKEEHKAQILEDYTPYIAGVLEADAGAQDEVVATVMLWSIDAGHYTEALQIAEYVLKHDLAMPDRYERTTACVIVEELAEAGIDGKAPAEVLLEVAKLTDGMDMPDQVRAKLHKALGRVLTETDQQAALNNYKLALDYHDGCGVKKNIEKLEREIKNKSQELKPEA